MSLLILKADLYDLTYVIFTSSFNGKTSVLAGKNSDTTKSVGAFAQHFFILGFYRNSIAFL